MIKGAHYTSKTSASAAAIWSVYKDVAGWKRWDTSMASSQLEGDFITGSHGVMKAKLGFTTPFIITDCEPNSHYTIQSRLPGSTMYIHHIITSTNDTRQLTHQLEFEGRLGNLWSRLFGPKLLKGGVDRILALAEGHN